MQKIITLILALALYAPNVASIMAYSKCEVEAIINKKPDCDCQLASLPEQKHPDNLPNRHKEIVQQTDWKYLVKNGFNYKSLNQSSFTKAYQSYQSPFHASLNREGVFRPPCC